MRRRGFSGGLESAEAYLASASLADYVPEETGEGETMAGEIITRGTKFTQPKTLTLNTKYDGVPKVEVWPGFAVLVVGSEGARRVVIGPEVILLEYDEKLGFMELSTGKPKSTDKLMRTAYLCIQNNQVGDIVSLESKDHVKGKIKLSLRVNFEGQTEEERLQWFNTDNYVKFLTDHVRSIVAGMAKRHTIADIKGDYVNLVRDAVLGRKPDEASKRPGLSFENGMRVTEVEVLDLTLDDAQIAQMLDKAQAEVVRSNIEIQQAQKDLEATQAKERISQEKSRAMYQTKVVATELARQQIEADLAVTLAKINSEIERLSESKKQAEANEEISDLAHQRQLARDKSSLDQDLAFKTSEQKVALELIDAQTKAAVERMTAAKDGLCEALVALGRDDMAAKLAEAVNIERYLTGGDLGSSIANILSFAPSVQQFLEKGKAATGNGSNRLQPTTK